MDEARRLLARLERIERLERDHAAPGELLPELRGLIADAEAWARAERSVPETAIEAVERCRKMLLGTSRTLLA